MKKEQIKKIENEFKNKKVVDLLIVFLLPEIRK